MYKRSISNDNLIGFLYGDTCTHEPPTEYGALVKNKSNSFSIIRYSADFNQDSTQAFYISDIKVNVAQSKPKQHIRYRRLPKDIILYGKSYLGLTSDQISNIMKLSKNTVLALEKESKAKHHKRVIQRVELFYDLLVSLKDNYKDRKYSMRFFLNNPQPSLGDQSPMSHMVNGDNFALYDILGLLARMRE